jgi:carboxylesterase
LTPLCEALSASGFHVITPMLSGHGNDVAALALTTREDWIRSADAALTSLIADGGAPVAIVGSSAGGLLAMHLALTRPGDIRSIVCLATPIVLSAKQALTIRLALLLPEALRPPSIREVRKRHGPNVSDPALAGTLRSLPAYPLAALGELLRLMSSVRARLSEIRVPVLIVHGALDSTVARHQVDALAAGLTHAAVQRLDLPASAHLVAIDRDRDQLAARVLSFLSR